MVSEFKIILNTTKRKLAHTEVAAIILPMHWSLPLNSQHSQQQQLVREHSQQHYNIILKERYNIMSAMTLLGVSSMVQHMNISGTPWIQLIRASRLLWEPTIARHDWNHNLITFVISNLKWKNNLIIVFHWSWNKKKHITFYVPQNKTCFVPERKNILCPKSCFCPPKNKTCSVSPRKTSSAPNTWFRIDTDSRVYKMLLLPQK